DSSTYAVLPDMNGRVFQGTTTVADVCKALEAQLPNIIGWIGDIPMGTNSGSNVYGALFQGEKWTTADIL
ncbi:hypothetical protein, partial [Parasutterella secunda]|uniref:hypothetical protein n=1 Tax=Parasutterella secunda TaxID=626947 RepID=UPI00196138FF